MARHGPLVALILTTIVFAGCAAEPEAKSEPTATVPVGSASFESETGSGTIQGVVTDDEKLPISQAKVSLVELNLEVLTGDAGNFEFTEIPVGEYKVGVSKIGYEAAFKAVTVAQDNETVQVDFLIMPIVIADSYMMTSVYNGKISCGILLVPVCGILQDVPVNPTEEKWIFNWTYTTAAAPVMMVTEMDWKATMPNTAQKLIPTILVDGDIVQDVSGSSPIRFVSDEDQLKAWFKKDKQLGVYPELADPVVDQRFTIYRSDFWGTPAPENWTVYPS